MDDLYMEEVTSVEGILVLRDEREEMTSVELRLVLRDERRK